MPYLSKEQRAQGGYAADPDDERRLPIPDQSRYGTATTDPLGRDGPGWKIGRHGLPVRVKGDDDD